MKANWKHFKGRTLLICALAFACGLSLTTLWASLTLQDPTWAQLFDWINGRGPLVTVSVLCVVACFVVPNTTIQRRRGGSDSYLDPRPTFFDKQTRNLNTYGNAQGIIVDNGPRYTGISD